MAHTCIEHGPHVCKSGVGAVTDGTGARL